MEDLIVSNQHQDNSLSSDSHSRKHPLDSTDASGLPSADNNNNKATRGARAKKQRLEDISVTDSNGHLLDHDDDDADDDSQDDFVADHSDSDEFLDPALLPASTTTRRARNNNATSTASIARSISRFMPTVGAIPSTSTSTSIAIVPQAGSDIANHDLNLASIDYTHISQVLAHQPMATNASQQTLELMGKMNNAGSDAKTVEEKLDAFMREVKSQMFSLSQRVDNVETARFTSAANITSLQQSIRAIEERTRTVSSNALASSLAVAGLSTDTDTDTDALGGASSSLNPVSDTSNATNAEAIGAVLQRQIMDIEAQGMMATTNYDESANKASGSGQPSFAFFMQPAAMKDEFGTQPAWKTTPSTSRRGRKAGTASTAVKTRAETPGGSDQKQGKRARKPELSRVVRSTMFRLLGLSLTNSSANPLKFHGYTSSPELPEFTTTVTFDSQSGTRIWRWEWDKTIRQSQYNAAFSTAIQNQINAERANDQHKDVPEEDWESLDDAVESAYTNLRRERDAQNDPLKKLKKDEHRKRGKKRGLKEEKCKRRTKAFLESKMNGNTDPDVASAAFSSWITVGGSNSMDPSFGNFDDFETALEIKYMSSEDEVDTNDQLVLATPVLDADKPSGSAVVGQLTPGEKTFALHRPVWRSQRLATTFYELDGLRPPERAYRRIVGEPRDEYPPEGTPGWMISADWGTAHPDSARPIVSSSGGKGKGKAK